MIDAIQLTLSSEEVRDLADAVAAVDGLATLARILWDLQGGRGASCVWVSLTRHDPRGAAPEEAP
jgi:hypothetical protein